LLLLWKGILCYALSTGTRYLVGCSSLTSQDFAQGCALYQRIQSDHLAPLELRTLPRPAHRIADTRCEQAEVVVPRLLRTYLELSAWICGPPAIDREFKAIDFLTLLDLSEVPIALKKRLLSH